MNTTTGTLLAMLPLCLTSAWAAAPGAVAISASRSKTPAVIEPLAPSRTDSGSRGETLRAETSDTAALEPNPRLLHARELLGKHYRRSRVHIGESIDDIGSFVHQAVGRRMPGSSQTLVKKVADTILNESRAHELDPLLIVAVIERESSFRPRIRGGVGEVGLMQILPSTGRWIAKREGIEWNGVKSLLDPETNIRIGTRYIAALREQLEADSPLYLAAYNMGVGGVLKLVKRNLKPRVYPSRIMKTYVQLYAELKQDLETPMENDVADSVKTTAIQ